MRLSEIYTQEIILKEFWQKLQEEMTPVMDPGLGNLLSKSKPIIFDKFNIESQNKQYFIAGSATMHLYPKIKDAFNLTGNIGDLDIVIPNKQLWENAGLKDELNQGGIYRPTEDGSIEAFTVWNPLKADVAYADASVRSTDEILKNCSLIDGYWFMSLTDVIDYKTTLNRDKEKDVVQLIYQYNNSNDNRQIILRKLVDAIGKEETRKFLTTLKMEK